MDPVVEVTGGRVRGRDVDGVAAFLGIPYAEPPLGERRLRRAVAHRGWSGEREAVSFGSRAVQPESMLAPKSETEDEDCLVLNVWTPAIDDQPRPVMVWIHGGSFTTGSAALSWYDGRRLAQRGVVVVTVNYRLGPLGFLHLEAIGGADWQGSANCGLTDQAMALEWVRDNIAVFGGDPANVTLFGESAGAMSVSAHLAMPASKGLFRRVIAQSGATGHVQASEQAAVTAEVVLERLGVGAHQLERLADVAVDDFRRAVVTAEDRLKRAALPLPFQPTIDGSTLPTAPLAALASGVARDVELLSGTTADEMRLWQLMAALSGTTSTLDEERLLRRIGRVVESSVVESGASAPEPIEVLAAYREAHPDLGPSDLWLAIATDLTFRLPAIRMLEAHHGGGGSGWLYLFTHPSTAFDGALGAAHSLEIPFVFDNLDKGGVELMVGSIDDGRRHLASAMADAWTGFARGEGLAVSGVGDWPQYEPGRRQTMVLDVDGAVVDDPQAATRRIWGSTDPQA